MLKKMIIPCVIAVFAQVAFGQQSAAGRPLSLQDCIKLALNRNTSVLQAQYQAESQDAKVLSAYGGLLPTVSGNGQFAYTDQRSPVGYRSLQGILIPTTGGVNINRQYQAWVTADYTLFNGFANYSTVNQANSAGESMDLGYERARQTAVYQTTQNYLAVFNFRDQLQISRDNLTRDQQQLESIKESNTVGSASLAQVYQQQATVSQDEYALVQAQNAYDQAQAALRFFLAIPVTDTVTFADPSVKSEIDTTEFVQVNQQFSLIPQLMGKALDTRSDYQAAQYSLDASKSSLSIANAEYSPTISLFTQYQLSGPQLTGAGTDNLAQNKSFYGGLSISIPIFNGFVTQSNIQQAGVAVKASEQTLDATKRQVALDVYQALLNLNASEKGYLAALNAVAAAKINLETEQEKFRIGGATLLDVLTANAQYTLALSSRVVAAYTYIQAKEQMEFAVGTINY